MKLDLHMFTRQWRRALLLISTVLALVAVILLHQCLDKNIFKLDVALNTDGIESLYNDTRDAVTSVAGEVSDHAESLVDDAGSVVDDAGSAIEDGWDAATDKVADIFARDTAAPAGPTPAPSLPMALTPNTRFLRQVKPHSPVAFERISHLFRRADDDDDQEDDGQTEFTLEIKPHTKVDLDGVVDIAILGDVLEFVLNLVIALTPLGFLMFLHVFLLVLFWIYVCRLIFRLATASPTPTDGDKSGKGSLVLKALSYLPCLAAPQAMFKILQTFFVPVLLAACFGFGLVVQWIDWKLWSLVQGENYDFFSLVTVDFELGSAPTMVQSAFILICIAIGLDLIETLITFVLKARAVGQTGLSEMVQRQNEKAAPLESVAISWPAPVHQQDKW